MAPRMPEEAKRSGLVLMAIGVVGVVVGYSLWFLVMATNPSGQHDAHLLPALLSIPAAFGVYRFFQSSHTTI